MNSGRKTSLPDLSEISPRFLHEKKTLLALVLIGAVLRLWFINWSLPDLFEEATPLVKSWKMWNWGKGGFDFNPHFFNYPALTFYLNFLVQALQFALGFVLGIYPDLQSFGVELSSIVVPARLLAVAFDVGTIWILALLVREHLDERTAIIAATLIAFNPLHIEQAHYIIVDTPLTFFIVLSLLFTFRMYRSGNRAWYFLAGASIGLAAATKYTGMILLPVLAVVHMARSQSVAKAVRSLRVPRLWLAMGISAAVFIAANPFIFVSYDEFVRDFSFEQFHITYGHLGLRPDESTVFYYAVKILPGMFGWPLLAIIIVTGAILAARKEKHVLLLGVFPLFYFIVITSWEMRASRYSLPMVPMLIALGAVGIDRLWNWTVFRLGSMSSFRHYGAPHLQRLAAIVIGTLVLAQPFVQTLTVERTFMSIDTRTIAREWILSRVKPGAAIATGPFGITIPDSSYRVLYIPFIAVEAERAAAFYDPRWYEDCDLLIASDYDESRYRLEPNKFQEFFPYFDTLRTRWQHLAEIKPGSFQTGPTFWYFAPPVTSPDALFDSSLFTRLESMPESAKVSSFLRDLSIVLIEKGRFAKAEQVLQNIVSVEPENLEARFTLARVLLTRGKNESALVQIQHIVFRDPTRPEIFVFAGDVLMNLGRGEEAEKSFLRAIAINGRYEAAYEDLIEYYTRSKQNEQLLTTLKRYRDLLQQGTPAERTITERIRQMEKR